MNKAILVGNLGADPEQRIAGSGLAIAELRLATTSVQKSEKHTDWHKVVLFGQSAEFAAQYCQKGDKVAVDGEIRYETYQSRDGETKYVTKIIGNRIEKLSGKSEQPQTKPAKPSRGQKPVEKMEDLNARIDDLGDLPF